MVFGLSFMVNSLKIENDFTTLVNNQKPKTITINK
jgi:hypothetical protein